MYTLADTPRPEFLAAAVCVWELRHRGARMLRGGGQVLIGNPKAGMGGGKRRRGLARGRMKRGDEESERRMKVSGSFQSSPPPSLSLCHHLSTTTDDEDVVDLGGFSSAGELPGK